jgi:tetratricopeptide (TPR) repeat protein
MAKKRPSPSALPQTTDRWYLSLREAEIPVLQKSLAAKQPCLLLLVDLTHQLVLALQVYPKRPTIKVIENFIQDAILKPQISVRTEAYRPAEIQIEQPELIEDLSSAFQNLGIAVTAGSEPELIDQITEQFSMFMDDFMPGPPGLLSVAGATPEMIAELFSAAAEYYRAAPWKFLTDEQPLAVEYDPPGKTCYISLMGGGGMEFGLVLYHHLDDLIWVYSRADSPEEAMPPSGFHSLSFERKEDVPSQDLKAIQEYGWKVANRRAYPMPLITTVEEVQRPPREELILYEALLKAIPIFVQRLQPDGFDDYLPAQVEVVTHTYDGEVRLRFNYPITVSLPRIDDEDESALLELDEHLRRANAIAHQAWLENDSQERIRLARQALEISSDCVEAYTVLAEESQDDDKAVEYLEQAVRAGERIFTPEVIDRLGEEVFEFEEAIPYLRARASLAESLEAAGRKEEALHQYLRLIELDAYDEQGARFNALNLLLQLKRDDEAETLIQRVEDEDYPDFVYSRALIAFRKNGDTPKSRRLLKRALLFNAHVPDYLSGKRPLPSEEEEFLMLDEQRDAAEYARLQYNNWWSTPGAINWLLKNIPHADGLTNPN